MAQNRMADLMAHHPHHLAFIFGVDQDAGVDIDEAAGYAEGIDLRVVHHLVDERKGRILDLAGDRVA